MDEYSWTVLEVALVLNLSLITINNLMASGQLRAHLQRGKVMIADSEVQRLLREKTTSGRSERLPRS